MYIYQLDKYTRIVFCVAYFYPQDSTDGQHWEFNFNGFDGSVVAFHSLYEARNYSLFDFSSFSF